MENPISISNINDFIFCPVSIYFHNLDLESNSILSQTTKQINGTHVHEKIDFGGYTSRKDILQGTSIFCEKYNLIGKIDLYNSKNQILVERKNKIVNIYDGYVFQLYAQYFSLIEMGYIIKKMFLYSYSDNKKYSITLPEENEKMLNKFEETISTMKNFDMTRFVQHNMQKCENCIYEPCCDCSII